MTNLLDILDEQSAINFSGRVNILGGKRELLGTITFLHGNLVNSRRNRRNSLENLNYFAFEDLESTTTQNYVVEPEIITQEDVLFTLTTGKFKKALSDDYSEYQKIKKLRPPKEVKLLPNVEFLESVKGITPMQFDLLSTISEYSLVSDIYLYSIYSPLNTTKILVSLRKMGAISVIKSV